MADLEKTLEKELKNREKRKKRMAHGTMVGCEAAITWVETFAPDDESRLRVLNRMRYEFDKDIPVRAKRHKGMHISDYYTCGNCGAGLGTAVHWKFCPNCGYAIKWK